MTTVSPDHPQLDLLFAIDGDGGSDDVTAMHEAVVALASSREWGVEPPEFVNETDDSSCTDPGDQPIVTIGGVLRLYSSFPPWGSRLPLEIDRAQLEDARAVIAAMAALSRERGLTIVFEYDGEAIGSIDEGTIDDSLATTFVSEWERSLAARSQNA